VEYDLEAREVMKYPPFSHLILVHFRGEDETEVRVFASGFTEDLTRCSGEGVRIQGPMPSPIDRIKGKYRFMTMIFGEKLGVVRRYLRHMVLHGYRPDGVDVYVDVDAQALL
jgi:primosomal protein N' (replication factor Y)